MERRIVEGKGRGREGNRTEGKGRGGGVGVGGQLLLLTVKGLLGEVDEVGDSSGWEEVGHFFFFFGWGRVGGSKRRLSWRGWLM